MADFMQNLWSSVFTPGATPTLLLATNLTFGALQALLLALLVATYSIHFAILSLLCGGLWYSINWFATELQAAQAKEAEAERIRKLQGESSGSKEKSGKEWRVKGEVADSEADDEGEDTETEEGGVAQGMESRLQAREQQTEGGAADERPSASGITSGAQSRLDPGDGRQRRAGGAESGYASSSTDSEWEKVDGGR